MAELPFDSCLPCGAVKGIASATVHTSTQEKKKTAAVINDGVIAGGEAEGTTYCLQGNINFDII